MKILDFGSATSIADHPDAANQTMTATGRALTPEYAAPQQAAGKPVTTATDVYALGVILETSAGKKYLPQLRGSTASPSNRSATLAQHEHVIGGSP